MRATIKDVAAAAGVSIKTVSRVLNNEKYVGVETRAAVEAAMATLSFSPSLAARSLAGRRSFQIALICDNPSPYYVYEMQAGVRMRCQRDGVRMLAQPYDRGSETILADILGLIDQVHPDGLILTPPVSDRADVLAELMRRDIAVVRVSPGSAPQATSAAFIDNARAAFDMTAYLIGLGHRRIGFVMGDADYAVSGQRREGYLRALAEAGIAHDPALVVPGRYDFASGSAAAERLLALDRRPTAIFASSDEIAAGVLAAAHRLGVVVPAELSVAGFDDTALASVVWPALTTVRQPVRQLAEAAADLLLDPPEAPEARLIAHELVLRDSTAPVSR